MPEVPNDGTHLTSETAPVIDVTDSASVFAAQPTEIQTDPTEAELIGVPIAPAAAG
ncbi:hypothetical protein NX773_07130 [Massilia solisilvae]|uniref:Uncharacterized protein n=1 Tax=Massilia solisilvae TaxID=1811225 RepID=A0ABT2BHD8_9BURK|nr:hypothetical protein [Massilia solisilvae]MCS0607933.1 hypothetical protein [Massilia solisilvae]